MDFSNGFFSTGGTMNSADLYGTASVSTVVPDTIAVAGPNQSSVIPLMNVGNGGGSAVAFSWVAFAMLLLGLRVVIELQNRAG